jgi:hypothetical protein
MAEISVNSGADGTQGKKSNVVTDGDEYCVVFQGGNGGNGGNLSETTGSGWSSCNFYGGPGGNGGESIQFIYETGSPGQSYNYASSAGIGNQSPAYTPITMADGTSAYVGYAGKQNEGGNCAQLLLYYQT